MERLVFVSCLPAPLVCFPDCCLTWPHAWHGWPHGTHGWPHGLCLMASWPWWLANMMPHHENLQPITTNLCYDFSNMEEFLKQKNVREALGVGDINFVSCSPTVYQAMLVDWMRNLEVGIPALLQDGIKLLVYAGEYDLICNWLGNSRWVHAMEWAGQKEFVASPEVTFEVDGSEAGVLKSHGPLSFLKVHDAGHMVPMDQPKASLQMLKRWTQGSLSGATVEPENLVSSV